VDWSETISSNSLKRKQKTVNFGQSSRLLGRPILWFFTDVDYI
jgi:hypothetical protein